MAKRRYPESLDFHFLGFDWEIRFISTYREDAFGITSIDEKYIHIYYGKRSDQVVIETLIHELIHVTLMDITDAIFHFEKEKVDDKEENLVLLTSPRIFSILRDNVELMDFIVKRIKSLDS